MKNDRFVVMLSIANILKRFFGKPLNDKNGKITNLTFLPAAAIIVTK